MQIKIIEGSDKEELEQKYEAFGKVKQIHYTQTHYQAINGISWFVIVIFYN